jgi:predicted permease
MGPIGPLRRLVGWMLPDGVVREGLLGDLDELYAERARRSRVAADVWYARQLLSISFRYAPRRIAAAWTHGDGRRMGAFEGLGADLARSLRSLRRRPGFAMVVVLTLALGIGANTAVFRVVEALRLRTLPISDPERLAIVEVADMSRWQGRRSSGYPVLSYPLWERIRDDIGPFDATLAWANTSFVLEGAGPPAIVRGLYVSGGFFEALGVPASMGRTIVTSDDRLGCALEGVVLGYGFWERAFGRDASIVGGTLLIDTHSVRVLGVSAPGFTGLEVGRAFDVAVPVCTQAILGGDEQWIEDGTMWWLTVMGRLGPNRPISAANAHLASRSPALFEATLPDGVSVSGAEAHRSLTLRAIPGGEGVSSLRGRFGDSFLALLGVTGLVLIVVCANLANLFLARGASREREFAVRRALGASRARLMRELTIESLVLAAAGAAASLALASVTSRYLVGLLGDDLALDLSITPLTLMFVLVAAFVSSAIFGLLPAVRTCLSMKASDGGALRDGRGGALAGGGPALRRGLVVSQVGLSFALVFGALLFVGSLRNLLAVDTGFRSASVVVLRADFRNVELSAASRPTFKRELLDLVRATPGVMNVAEVRHVPLGGTGSSATVRAAGATQGVAVRLNGVTDEYLETLSMPVLRGRDFAEGDAPDAPVAVVTPAFAARVGLGADPVGKTFAIEGGDQTLEVIGLVADAKYFDLREEAVPTAFVPKALLADSRAYTDFMIRTASSPDAARETLQAAFGVESNVRIDVRPFEETIRAGLVRERLLSTVAGAFGLLAVLVASIGVYGVMSQYVTSRRTEIGVRIALGATRADVLRIVLVRAGSLLGAGLVVGGFLSYVLSLPLQPMLFGLDGLSLPAFAWAAGILSGTAALASGVPARRAARLQPRVALSSD